MTTTFRRARSGLYIPRGAATTYTSAVLADSPLAYFRLGEAFAAGVTSAASSTNFSSEPPANAFDGSTGTNWTTSSGNVSGWLRAQMTSATVLTAYRIRRRDDLPNRNPKTWTFQGSNDASTWTTLDTQTNVTWPTSGETKSFTFSNSTAYLYYRVNITANNGDASFTSITELYLMPAMADSSGNSRNGEYQGGVAGGATGLITSDSNTAVTFAGGAGIIPFASWMNLGTVAIEAIINMTSSGVFQLILDRDPGSGTRIFQFRVNSSNKLEMIVFTGSTTTVTGATTLSAGTKYHVVGVFDGTTAKVYVNGVQDASVSISGTLLGSTGTGSVPMRIGQSESGTAFPFGGVLDEVAIYSSLSATRIAAHAALV